MNYSPYQITEISKKIYDILLNKEILEIELFLQLFCKKTPIDCFDYNQYNYHSYETYITDIIKKIALHDSNLIIEMAIDLGITVPNITYSITEIKHKLDVHNYQNARKHLEEACQKLYSEPAIAFQLANTTLESIIKHICEDKRIESCKNTGTLYGLAKHILKQFNHFQNKAMEENVRNIGSGFMTISQAIENIRSNFTPTHGKNSLQLETDEPIYSALAINSAVTLGLFLIDYYEKNYPFIEEDDPQF